MRVLHRGEDEWRKFRCNKCHSVVEIEDADVTAELFWDGEDGCNDEGFHVVCVCGFGNKFLKGVPAAVQEAARKKAGYSKEDVGSKVRKSS